MHITTQPSTRQDPLAQKATEFRMGNFHVFEQPSDQWCETRRVVKKWRDLAKQKLENFKEIKILDETAKIFDTSFQVFDLMTTILPNSNGLNFPCVHRWNRVLVCEVSDEIQAVAIFHKKTNSLIYLGSNPSNIPHDSNSNRVKGAGTALILFIVQMTLNGSLTSPISVIDPAKRALSFYERFGFTFVNNHNLSLSANCEVLQLTSKKIEESISLNAPIYQGLSLS